ncbi:MAG: hypothetical protein H8F28_02380 [Fibrella sp.]|nr:hypothetical protein [Armatimonadota bacterium]
MAKLSRSAFLYSLGATGVFFLTGCGSGTTKNTIYGGVYRSAYTISQLNEAGAFNFTVDVKGNITGSLDNQNGTVREVTGSLKNDGSFEADTFNRVTNTRGRLTGTMSGLLPVQDPSAPAQPVLVTGGNFTLTETNVQTVGSFQVDAVIPAPGSSGFQGFYNGVYNIPELNQNGTTSFSVDSAGRMTGQLTRNDETGLLTGTVQSSGNFTAAVVFRNETSQYNGTLIKTTDNSTLGNFTQTVSGRTVAGSFGATTIPTGDSQYQGSYRGTYSLPEQSESGNISFTVDPTGALTGFFSQTKNQPVGTFTGAFQNDGRFTGVLTYEPTSNIAARPITGRVGTATVGGGPISGDFVLTIDGVNRPGNFQVTGGSEPDSLFRGSYSSTAQVGPTFSVSVGTPPSGTIPESGQFEFTVDKQGELLGSVREFLYRIAPDGIPEPIALSNAVVCRFRLTNDGRFSGTINGYAAEGKVSKQVIPRELNVTTTVTPVPAPSVTPPATPAPTPSPLISREGEVLSSSGVAGNMEIRINGTTYIATFFAAGGFVDSGG